MCINKLMFLSSIMSSKSFLSYFKKPVNSVNNSEVNDVNTNEGSSVNIVNSSTACDIDFVSKQPYHPVKDFSFPKTKFGSGSRFCQHNWFDTHSWFHHDLEKDCIICFYCIKNFQIHRHRNKQGTSIHINWLQKLEKSPRII